MIACSGTGMPVPYGFFGDLAENTDARKTKTTGLASDQFAKPVVFKMKKGGKNEKVIVFMIL